MAAEVISEDAAPGRVARERVHVALPTWAPHNGRIIQVMPGKKIPVDPEGKELPIVWSESMDVDIETAHAEFLAGRRGETGAEPAVLTPTLTSALSELARVLSEALPGLRALAEKKGDSMDAESKPADKTVRTAVVPGPKPPVPSHKGS